MRNLLFAEPDSACEIENFDHDLTRLFGILKMQRPAKSQQENNLATHLLNLYEDAWPDDYGNVIVPVKMEESYTMFSCHTDTVHPKPNKEHTSILYADTILKQVFTNGLSQLGADDGAGVWFMMNMIEAGVAGLYIFHRDEEVGGLGSSHFAKYHEDYLTQLGIKRCVAFDRHYYKDVITHQGTRCCSDNFAQALSNELNMTDEFEFEPCDTGVFTDSANYTHIIQECTNLSVGYWAQHSVKEVLDYGFASQMLARLVQVDWENLPTERDVNDNDYAYGNDWHQWSGRDYKAYDFSMTGSTNHTSYSTMIQFIEQNSDYVAEYLLDLDITESEIIQHVGIAFDDL